MKNSNLLAEISVQQLKRALAIKQEIADLEQQLDQLWSQETPAAEPVPRPRKRKRRMSAAARAKISAAQTARWAKTKTVAAPAPAAAKKKRVISAEGRARLIAGAKARWAKYNAAKKKKAALS